MVETIKTPDLQEQIKDGVQQPEIKALNDFLDKPENAKLLIEKMKSAGEQNLIPVIHALKDALPDMDLSVYTDLKAFINVVEALRKIFPFSQNPDLKNAFSDLQAVLETKKPVDKGRYIDDDFSYLRDRWDNNLPYLLKKYKHEILPIKRDTNLSKSPNLRQINRADFCISQAIARTLAGQSSIDESLISSFVDYKLPQEDRLKDVLNGQKNKNLQILNANGVILPDNVDNVYRALSNLKIVDKYFALSPEEKKNFAAIETSCGKGFSSQLSNFKFTAYADLNTFENKTSLFKERFPNTDLTPFITKLKTAWVDLLKNSPILSDQDYTETAKRINLFASKFVDKTQLEKDPVLLILRSNLQAKFLTLITNTPIDANKNSLSFFRKMYTDYSKDFPKDEPSLKNLQNIEKKYLLETVQIKDIRSLNTYKTIRNTYSQDMVKLGMTPDIALVDAMTAKYKSGFESIMDNFIFTKDSISIFKTLKTQYAADFPNDPTSSKLTEKYKESYTQFLEKFSLSDGHPQDFVALYTNFIKENPLKPGDVMQVKLVNKMSSLFETWLLQTPLTKENIGSTADKTITSWDKTKVDFYKRFPIISPELKDQIEAKETAFRREEILKNWNNSIDFEGFEFNLNNPALQKEITSSLSAIQNETLDMIQSGKLEKVTLKSIYERSIVGKEPLSKFVPEKSIQKIDLLFADKNRESMAINFLDMLKSDPKLNSLMNSKEKKDIKEINEIKIDFSTILLNTPNTVINSMMKEINTLSPSATNTVFKSIFDKIVLDRSDKTQDDKLVSFSGLKVDLRLVGKTPPQLAGTTNLKKTVLPNLVAPKTFEVNFVQMKANLLGSFDNLSTKNIAKVTISIPKSSPTSTNWKTTIEDIIATKYPNLHDKVTIQERTDGSDQIAIESKEKREYTEKVQLEIPDLESNTFPSADIIKEKLANSPKFQSFINDPTWKIASGKISAFASNTTNTTYKANPQFEKYKGDKVFIDRNEALAFDRAAAFVDYFNTNAKVDSNVQWTIDSAVGGQSKKDLDAINSGMTPEQLQALRKTRQKATLDLTFVKTEELAPNLQAFVTTETYTKDVTLQMDTARTFSGSTKDILDGGGTAMRNTGDWIKSGISDVFAGNGHVTSSGGCGCDGWR